MPTVITEVLEACDNQTFAISEAQSGSDYPVAATPDDPAMVSVVIRAPPKLFPKALTILVSLAILFNVS